MFCNQHVVTNRSQWRNIKNNEEEIKQTASNTYCYCVTMQAQRAIQVRALETENAVRAYMGRERCTYYEDM